MDRGRMLCDERDRDWIAAAVSQGMPNITGSHQKLEDARSNASPETSEGACLCQHLLSDFCPPGGLNFCCVKPLSLGHFATTVLRHLLTISLPIRRSVPLRQEVLWHWHSSGAYPGNASEMYDECMKQVSLITSKNEKPNLYFCPLGWPPCLPKSEVHSRNMAWEGRFSKVFWCLQY